MMGDVVVDIVWVYCPLSPLPYTRAVSDDTDAGRAGRKTEDGSLPILPCSSCSKGHANERGFRRSSPSHVL